MDALRTVSLGALIVLVFVSRAALCGPGSTRPDQTGRDDAGTLLYRTGLLSSGQPVEGTRGSAESLLGPQAACANCHRRSGLGSEEGRSVIPPITGRFLFHPHTGSAADIELPFVPGARPARAPYTEETLARALREGIDADGRQMSYLMPRYALGDADMAALIAHLKTLDRRKVPGVSETELHFATIITPDVNPADRRAMLDVLEHFFTDRNNTQRLPSAQSMVPSGNALYVKGMFKVTRRWVLHIWEPQGPASTWNAQLQKAFAAQPVFAVVSGLGGANWEPVQQFCEQTAVPCLFPNVELPPANADQGYYSLYFSRGVLLEADLIRQALTSDTGSPVKRVIQVYRQGDVGAVAAAALAAPLPTAGVQVTAVALPANAKAPAVAAAVKGAGAGTALVLWLRPADIAALPDVPESVVYLSGVMGRVDENPLPAAWRDRAHVAYTVDLPDLRRVRLDYPLGWFRVRKIPVENLRVQADTWLACGLATETIKHMVDTFVPDYLVERLEDTTEHRIITGYYPRLSLGPHQRFASKGGYLVHAVAGLSQWSPDGPWMAP